MPPFGRNRLAQQAQELLENGEFKQVIDLLQPLADHPGGDGEIQSYLAMAYTQQDALWAAAWYFDQAQQRSRQAEFFVPLAGLYLSLDLEMLALHAIRQAPKRVWADPELTLLKQAEPRLEAALQNLAEKLGLPLRKAEPGFMALQQGIVALYMDRFSQSLQLFRRAAEILKNYPPPFNNMTLALIHSGKSEEALSIIQKVLGFEPDNLHAQTNLITLHHFAGRQAEAQTVWEKLKLRPLQSEHERQKMVEAAAWMQDDTCVRDLLRQAPADGFQHDIYLAIAEANLGNRRAAMKLLKPHVEAGDDWAEHIDQALRLKRPGLGRATRFSYQVYNDILNQATVHDFLRLFTEQDESPSPRIRRQIEQLLERFPQVILLGEKMLLEREDIEVGLRFLEALGTERAFQSLLQFATSQQGTDEERREALFYLQKNGQIVRGQTIRIWQEGEWVEVRPNAVRVFEGGSPLPYGPKTIALLNRATEALRKDRLEQAEQLFLQALQTDPTVREAYNNLSVIYLKRQDPERAIQMLQKAVEIDPLYAMAAGNLANLLMNDGEFERAKAILAPLAQLEEMERRAFSFYSIAQARLALHEEEFQAAEEILRLAKQIDPDNQTVQDFAEEIERVLTISQNMSVWQSRFAQRDRAARQRQQSRLTQVDFSLDEALQIYNKDTLSSMARNILTFGGWSTLKKDPLRALIAENLPRQDVLENLLAGLEGQDRFALANVLARGGAWDWQEFSQAYDNDLDESSYWQYHDPETTMGRLRHSGLLFEATVDGKLLLVVPKELRALLADLLKEIQTDV